MELQKRKPIRLKNYDYSSPGAYFITICTHNRKELLSEIIVGDDAHIVPKNHISKYGLICDKYINNINIKYENVTVDKYVIMPNHIHLIIILRGTMRASSPTLILGETLCNCGKADFQRKSTQKQTILTHQ